MYSDSFGYYSHCVLWNQEYYGIVDFIIVLQGLKFYKGRVIQVTSKIEMVEKIDQENLI